SGKLNARFAFPLGTFSANMLASFLTGAAVSMQAAGLIPESAYPLVDVGFCATLSTFSALSWEIAEMIKAKKFAAASAYASATFASGMAIFASSEILFFRWLSP
ncbi:MAG: CrcB family protein, partial [Opitutales bacterium]|nr:CrcB family protein [Opitutales bacterium]